MNRKALYNEAHMLRAAGRFGAALAGRPDIVIAVKDVLKKKSRKMADVFVKNYNEAQYSLDMEYSHYDDWEPSKPIRVAAQRVAKRYMMDNDLLILQPAYGQSDAALPRGEHSCQNGGPCLCGGNCGCGGSR